MKKSTLKLITLIGLSFSITMTSCSDDEDTPPIANNGGNTVNTPSTYDFTRNGMSTVSYSGQTDRLNQVAEMKSYIQDATNNKTKISEQTLIDMFENTGGNANGNFSFSSTKQLSNKTFDADRQDFLDMFKKADDASDSAMATISAKNGSPGVLTRSNGKVVLLDANGHEFTQELEKGLMGATFYYQIVNVYLTDDKIGSAINNTDLKEGKNYTAMEHHMDEAFGYYGAPEDFTSNYAGTINLRYWPKYSGNFDATTPLIDEIMNPFKRARQAIVEKKYDVKDAEVIKLNEAFEVLIAATTIHYINESLSSPTDADRLHVLSEAYYFLKAFRYSNFNHRKLSQSEVDEMLNIQFGDNLWEVETAGLNTIKTKLSKTYGLESVKDQL